jgi:hypothetical protein
VWVGGVWGGVKMRVQRGYHVEGSSEEDAVRRCKRQDSGEQRRSTVS